MAQAAVLDRVVAWSNAGSSGSVKLYSSLSLESRVLEWTQPYISIGLARDDEALTDPTVPTKSFFTSTRFPS